MTLTRPRPLGGWLLLGAALAVVSFGGISHEQKSFLRSPQGKATFSFEPIRLLDEVRIDLVDDGDALRYRAYVRAALGRPYQTYYVRTARQWLWSFAAGLDSDPDLSPVRAPARPLLPYRDFLVEYPPGFFLIAVPPALLTDAAASYVSVFCLLMALCLACAVLLCARVARRLGPRGEAIALDLPRWSAVAVLALGTVTTHRYDAAVALALCALVAAALEEQPVLSGLALALAVALKLTPLLLAPVLAAWFASRDRRSLFRFAAAAAVVSLALWWPALAIPGFADMFRYHLQRPLQTESTAAALVGIARLFSPGSSRISFEFGSLNFVGPLAARASAATAVLGVVAPLLAIAVVCRRILRGSSREVAAAALADGVVVVLVALMTFSKVFSPQYLVWILPLGLLAALRRSRGAALFFIAILIATQIIYPFSYGAASRGEAWVAPLVLLRNGLLMACALWLLRPSPAPGESTAQPA